MKRKIDWLQFGQFQAMLNTLLATIKDHFKSKKIGPEIIEWANGPGKFFLEKHILPGVSEEYIRFLEKEKQKVETLKPATLFAEVDLDIDPVVPFDGAVLIKHIKQGKARFEYRPDEDELYINGKKFVPWLSPAQLVGPATQGIELEPEANKNNSLNATVADWLYEHPEFMPKKHQVKVWYFWASEWTAERRRCVSGLCWDGKSWFRRPGWLGYRLNSSEPSASLES